jgi:hypothetical protein
MGSGTLAASMYRSNSLRAGALALIALAVGAGLASAATKDARIGAIEHLDIDSGFGAGISAACPANQAALSGGVIQSGGPGGIQLNASGPLDETGMTLNTKAGDTPRMWHVSVAHTTGTQRHFTVLVICAAANARLEAKQVDATPEDGLIRRRLSCPSTRRAVGGGMVHAGTTTSGLFIHASGPVGANGAKLRDGDVPRGWSVAFDNQQADTTKTVRVFAVCAKRSHATVEAESLGVPDQATREERARCKGPKHAIGGGFTHNGGRLIYGNTSGPLNASGVVENIDVGDVMKSWYASLQNVSGRRAKLTVFAICESAKTGRSGTFRLGKPKLHRKNGTATLNASVPGAGRLVLSGKRVKKTTKSAKRAGKVKLPIKPTGDAKQKLHRTGKVNVTAKVTFTPTGGRARTKSVKVKLVEKR